MENAKIKTYRKSKGLSLVELSAKINLHPSSLSRIERGQQQLTVPVAKRLAEVTGKSAKYWLF